jgi:hypothetical protein
MNKGAQILLPDQKVNTPPRQSHFASSSQGSPYGTPRTKTAQNIMQGNGLEGQEVNHFQASSIEDNHIIHNEQRYDLEEVEYHMTDIDEVASIADNSMI